MDLFCCRKMVKFCVTYKQDQERLLKYFKDGNLPAFNNLLKRKDKNKIDPNHEYTELYGMTILAEASKEGKVEFIKVLLENNADPNVFLNGKAPIHFAAENGKLDAIKCLVDHTNINAMNRMWETALHLSARSLRKDDNAEMCFSYLASLQRMHVSQRNIKGQSAISEAVDKCSRDTLQEVLKRRDLTAEDRKLILDKYPDLQDSAPESAESAESTESAYTHVDAYIDLKDKNFERFRDKFKEEFVKTDQIPTTFLQHACKEGLLDIVKFLLYRGADVNTTGTHESMPPVYLACWNGHDDVLERLFKTKRVKVELFQGKTLLHKVLEGFDHKEANFDRYRKCFDYLLQYQEQLIPINHSDDCGHTALHYAVNEDNDHFATALLARGAYIGSLNNFDICPLNDIAYKTLEIALNNCVECVKENKGNEKNIDDPYTLKFNFSILNPTARRHDSERLDDPESGGRRQESSQENSQEMFPLYFISQSKKLDHLLKHPVLLVFLHMKWARISMMFYLYMIFYIIFVILLTLNILSDTNTCSECNHNSECYRREMGGIQFFLLSLSVVLIFTQLMQLYMLPNKCSYFRKLENWLEVFIIIFTVLILVGICSKILASVTLLLAWTEVMLQLGCIYKLAVYNEMLKRVTVSYLKFLLWYTPLIIAFTLSFYKMYHKETYSQDKGGNYSAHNISGNSSTEDNNVDFYSDLPMTLLKTVIMMIGELEASNMTFYHGRYFVFLSFVFMMTIVLMNLLNGLAVSDTQAIKNDAELVTCKSRVRLMHHFERLAFGRSGRGRGGYRLIGRSPSLWRVWQGKLLKAISLFPELKNDSLKITHNPGIRYINSELEKKDEEFRPDTCFRIGKYRIGCYLDGEVIEAAKDIVDRTRKESDQIESRISKMEEQLATVMRLLEQLVNNSQQK
jgi:ankyrin repeat protein